MEVVTGVKEMAEVEMFQKPPTSASPPKTNFQHSHLPAILVGEEEKMDVMLQMMMKTSTENCECAVIIFFKVVYNA